VTPDQSHGGDRGRRRGIGGRRRLGGRRRRAAGRCLADDHRRGGGALRHGDGRRTAAAAQPRGGTPVRARPGRLSALSVFLYKSVFYGAFV
jgi:hypothetical protein